jgi:hypothetical protein
MTTWVRSQYPVAIYIDLLDSQIRSALLVDPSRLKKFIPDSYKGWVILDEIDQLVPERIK